MIESFDISSDIKKLGKEAYGIEVGKYAHMEEFMCIFMCKEHYDHSQFQYYSSHIGNELILSHHIGMDHNDKLVYKYGHMAFISNKDCHTQVLEFHKRLVV
jgi:hypothetical protein